VIHHLTSGSERRDTDWSECSKSAAILKFTSCPSSVSLLHTTICLTPFQHNDSIPFASRFWTHVQHYVCETRNPEHPRIKNPRTVCNRPHNEDEYVLRNGPHLRQQTLGHVGQIVSGNSHRRPTRTRSRLKARASKSSNQGTDRLTMQTMQDDVRASRKLITRAT
jgi:hypothetical protein